MSEEDKKFAILQTELQALRLMVQEAMAIALSHEANPDRSASFARQDLSAIIAKTKEAAKDGPNAEFRLWFAERVGKSVADQMDAVEKRVSTLTQNRTQH